MEKNRTVPPHHVDTGLSRASDHSADVAADRRVCKACCPSPPPPNVVALSSSLSTSFSHNTNVSSSRQGQKVRHQQRRSRRTKISMEENRLRILRLLLLLSTSSTYQQTADPQFLRLGTGFSIDEEIERVEVCFFQPRYCRHCPPTPSSTAGEGEGIEEEEGKGEGEGGGCWRYQRQQLRRRRHKHHQYQRQQEEPEEGHSSHGLPRATNDDDDDIGEDKVRRDFIAGSSFGGGQAGSYRQRGEQPRRMDGSHATGGHTRPNVNPPSYNCAFFIGKE